MGWVDLTAKAVFKLAEAGITYWFIKETFEKNKNVPPEPERPQPAPEPQRQPPPRPEDDSSTRAMRLSYEHKIRRTLENDRDFQVLAKKHSAAVHKIATNGYNMFDRDSREFVAKIGKLGSRS
ncbi:MAG: hypothetical protein WAX89_05620 [Alphaproteobacteria bacterium]